MPNVKRKSVLLASSWWNDDIKLGLARYATRANWHLDMQMALTGSFPEDWRGDGMIAMPSHRQKSMLRFLAATTSPVVAINLSEPQLHLHRVASDSEAIGRLAADHFLDRAFRSFAWYSIDWGNVEELRCKGFRDTLRSAGFDCTLLPWPLCGKGRKNTWQSRQEWLQGELAALQKPLAVFSTDDTVAVEVISACLEADLRIPEDVAVLGCGDIEIFRESTSVPLSSIRVDFDRIIREACDLLTQLMDGQKIPVATRLLPPGDIVIRRSTDTLVSSSPEVGRAIRYMFDNFDKLVGIPAIAAAAEVSKTRLYEAFQKELGQSPGAVLTRIRLDKAQRMLRETEQKISEVARDCGLREPINLYRHFRRHLGMSPRAYREMRATTDSR